MKTTIYLSSNNRGYLQPSSYDPLPTIPAQAYLIHTRTVGDYNRVTYSLKKQVSTKDKTRTQFYFVPDSGADMMAVKSTFERGKQFATERDGFLFGAYVELNKLGKIITVQA